MRVLIDNFQKSVNSITIFYYILSIIFVSLIYNNLFLTVSLSISFFILNLAINRQTFLKYLKFSVVIFLVTVVFNLVINQQGNTLLFELFRIKITVESLLNSVTLGVSFINLLFAFFVYNELIHNKQIYQVLSKNFKSIAIIFILTTKFIPRIVNVINNSRFMLKFNEQKKDSESKFNIFKKNIELIGTVFDKVIPNFMNMSDTLIIRGYTSNNISKSKKSKKNLDDIILRSLIGFEMLLSILFVVKKYGKVDFGSANIKITFNSYILVILILNILIVLIPIIMGGVHLLWWKLHHSETIRSDTQITSLYR